MLAQFVVGIVGARQGLPDERAPSGLPLDQPLVFKFAVGPVDGIGVDGDLSDDITNRGKLVPRSQNAQVEGLAHLLHQLPIDREPRVPVEPEAEQCLIRHVS